MKRMIRAAKQLGSHAAKKILDWVRQTGEVSTRKGIGKIAAAVVLGVIITTTVVAKPYNCIPCKENNYCIKGIRYECPLDKPVTQGNRKTSEDACMTCIQRNG